VVGRFLLGSGLGALVGTGLLALASVMSPPPPQLGGMGKTADVAAPAESVVESAMPEVAPVDETLAQAPEAEPEGGIEAPAETPPESEPETAPSLPQIDLAETALAPEGAVVTEPAPDLPALAEAPETVPAPESLAGIADDAMPQPGETPAAAPDLTTGTAPDALAEPAGDTALATAPASDLIAPTSLADPAQPGALEAESAPLVAEMPELPPLTPEEEAMLRQIAEEGPGSALPPELLPEDPGQSVTEATPPQKIADPEISDPDPAEQVVVLDPASTPSTLPASPSLESAPEGVKTNLLPRIGDAAIAPDATATAEVVDDRPLVAFAQTFDNPEGKPIFAIILIDDGSDELDRVALAALPFPVSFALDPTAPKAAEHAAIYRAGGQEVLILAGSLFKGASASDVAVTLAAMTSALPETVAVMDTPERAFQGDRPLASLVVPEIGALGRGVVSWDQGLNAADQVARREGVPTASAFRDLDAAAEATPVIRRYLDRAAFKAAQEGRVTVVGRTRPETIAAILEWTVEGRAATVELAPISAVLTVE